MQQFLLFPVCVYKYYIPANRKIVEKDNPIGNHGRENCCRIFFAREMKKRTRNQKWAKKILQRENCVLFLSLRTTDDMELPALTHARLSFMNSELES